MSRDVRNPSPAYNTSCPSILMIASSVPTRSTFLLPTQPFSPKSSALKFEHSPSFFPLTRSTQISPRDTSSTPIPFPNPDHNQSLFPGYPVHAHRLDLHPLPFPFPLLHHHQPRPQSLRYCPTHSNPPSITTPTYSHRQTSALPSLALASRPSPKICPFVPDHTIGTSVLLSLSLSLSLSVCVCVYVSASLL
jgi:hypothetical protein